jgi:UDP-glucuronate 4-epimerase
VKILVTGMAGFIGFHLARRLADRRDEVVGIDNLNDYYDVRIKYGRLEILDAYPNVRFLRMDLTDKPAIDALFAAEGFDAVVNLAAQAGVRYSLTNPEVYVQSNIVGFLNILEACRAHPVKHLVYASSSSVYGSNAKIPFSTHDPVDHPVSLYAASKKSNELMAHTYSHLFGIPSTGLRFFTAYGPWGRPDMALFLFTKAILEDRPIQVFNHGQMRRDFTYIDDIVEGVVRVLDRPPRAEPVPYKVYNLAQGTPVRLLDYIEELERCLGKVAVKEFLPLQPGDVPASHAEVDDLMRDVGWKPTVPVSVGIPKFVEWYVEYSQETGS